MKKMIRYRIKPGDVAENERLIKEVYTQLHQTTIPGFHYAAFKMPDGVSFVHLAFSDSDEANKTFSKLPAFRNFHANLEHRCDEMPVVSSVSEIGSYQFQIQ